MPYVLSRDRHDRHRHPRYGRDPLTGQDRVPLKDPYGSSIPLYRNVGDRAKFVRPPRQMRITTGSKSWGIADEPEAPSKNQLELIGQRRNDGAFFGPPNPGRAVGAALPVQKPSRPSSGRSTKQQMGVHGGRITRPAYVTDKPASQARSLIRCLPCGTSPPKSMTKRVHLIYGDVAVVYVRNRYDILDSGDLRSMASRNYRQLQQQTAGANMRAPNRAINVAPQDEPRHQFAAFSAMAREGRGRRQADIRIPGSQVPDEMTGVPTIGPSITYVAPSAVARVDGVQLVSPKVDLGSPVHGGFFNESMTPGTAMARIIEAKSSKFFVVADGVEQGPFPYMPNIDGSQQQRSPRPGKQGSWPKDDGVAVGDAGGIEEDEAETGREDAEDAVVLGGDNNTFLPSKRRVSVENLMATNLVTQISSEHGMAADAPSESRPESALGPPDTSWVQDESMPVLPPRIIDGTAEATIEGAIVEDFATSALTAASAAAQNQLDVPEVEDATGTVPREGGGGDDEIALSEAEGNLSRDGSKDSVHEEQQIMHRPVIMIKRGHQKVRKVAIVGDDELMETASGRFRVKQEGDSVIQDGDESILDLDPIVLDVENRSVLDLDNRSVISHAAFAEIMGMDNGTDEAVDPSASLGHVRRPLTRELTSPPIVTVGLQLNRDENIGAHTTTLDASQRPIPSTVLLRR